MFQPNIFEGHRMFNMASRTSASELGRMNDEDYETRSGTETTDAPSGDEQDPSGHRANRKRYHRHTQRQINELESFFKECPHPDDKQRKELSRELGLEPLQIKFWFQNKRTQKKARLERHHNQILKAENDELCAANSRYKEALSNATCPKCGGPSGIGEMSFDEQHLRIENARLRDEIAKMTSIIDSKYSAKPSSSSSNFSQLPSPMPDLGFGNVGTQSGLVGGEMYGGPLKTMTGPTEADKPVIIELAIAAMEELMIIAQAGEPLWIPNQNNTEVLNDAEYVRTFPRGIGPKPLGLISEASRESVVVIMNHVSLVEILMDVNQWSSVFCGVLSRAYTVEVLSTGVAGNYNGALQVMTAEFQVPSPLVPTREYYFLRYSKKHDDGTWAVVDVSLDSLRPSPMSRGRRRPSGCLIRELPNGYSKVIWVEHVEVDDQSANNIYGPLLNSGLAFGAKRWLATLDRQCERIASSPANNFPAANLLITSPEERKSMLKLAERMTMTFCTGVGASTAHAWTAISATGFDDVRVMTRKSLDDPGRPPGIVLCAATSFWIPVPPKRVFDFLRNENSRSEWDILSNGGLVEEMSHIAYGRDPGNCVSLLRVNSANTSESNMLILQESCSDSTGSYVIYAPVDIVSMNMVLGGTDPDYVALLPSGFAILPDGTRGVNNHGGIGDDAGNGGSLLTVAFQILIDSAPTAKLSLGSVATVNSLINSTVERIKTAVMRDNA